MNRIMTLGFGVLAASLFTVAAQAADGEFTIFNDTQFFMTSKINDFLCSSAVLGEEKGTTNPGDHAPYNIKMVNQACAGHKSDCKLAMHMEKDCGGEVVAIAELNLTEDPTTHQIPGIVNVVNKKSDQFDIHFTAFDATISTKKTN